MADPPKDKLNYLISLYHKNKFSELASEIIVERLSYPKSLTLLNLQGAVYIKLKKLNLAHQSYKYALQINNNSADVLHNYGYLLKLEGKTSEAIKYLKKAIEVNPNYDEAFNNLGVCFHHEGDFNNAVFNYKAALKINPKRYDIYNNLGIAFYANGDTQLAIENYKMSLEIHPNNSEVYFNLGIALKNFQFTQHETEFYPILDKLLDNNYTRPREVSFAIISLIKLNPKLTKVLEKFKNNRVSVTDLIVSLMEINCFIKLLYTSVLCDIELERVIKKIRSELLFSINDIPENSLIKKFQTVLASHCFLNEYLYTTNSKERDAINSLEKNILKKLKSGQQPNPSEILCLASFKALYDNDWHELLINNSEINAIFETQIVEKQVEDKLKLSIKKLTEISNEITLAVQEQYEENPYPRWKYLQKSIKPKTLSDLCVELNLKIYNENIKKVKNPKILIAGCGTGQQSIEASVRYKNCDILAIDISSNSLAYAKRKSEEFGCNNIRYIQADILDLKKLGMKFDMIHCVGVLHHMSKPLMGLKVLCDILNPNGLIKLGYYSELARKKIVRIRDEIQKLGIKSDRESIIKFRESIIQSEEKYHMEVLKYADFYSVSAIRDMLFHVEEKRFNLPQISMDLDNCSLKFCGFDEKKVIDNFISIYRSKDDLYNLDKWNSYEHENPKVFMGMYQFWAQKILR